MSNQNNFKDLILLLQKFRDNSDIENNVSVMIRDERSFTLPPDSYEESLQQEQIAKSASITWMLAAQELEKSLKVICAVNNESSSGTDNSVLN